MSFVITIDGPAGAGKSTTARAVADRLGFLYLDTGALYRALAYKALNLGLSPEDDEALERCAAETRLGLAGAPGAPQVWLDGVEVGGEIRTPAVSEMSSRLAARPAIRRQLVEIQRRLRERGPLVAEGRDLGTVVFPDAEVKVYLDADHETRVKRRHHELVRRGLPVQLQDVAADLQRRDERDRQRADSPLVPASDAVPLDTSGLTAEQQVEAVLDLARKHPRFPSSLGRTAREAGQEILVGAYYSATHFVVGKVLGFLARWEVRGRQHVPRSGGMVVAANHISFWDPPLIATALPREIYFLAKEELFRTPGLGVVIRGLNAIPIRRGVADLSGLSRALEVLQRGRALLMFPEGSRMRDGELHPARPGVGMMAVQADVPVLPCYISGSGQPRRWLLGGGRVRIWFGPARPWRDLVGPEADLTPGRALYQKVGDAVMREIAILKTGQETSASRGAA